MAADEDRIDAAGLQELGGIRFDCITEVGRTDGEILHFAFESLNRRLRTIGINLAA